MGSDARNGRASNTPQGSWNNQMHRTTKTAVKIAALTAIALVASATAANASVTIDSAGKGFVGKGNVQTALGMNNSALQKAVDAKSLVFTAAQPTSSRSPRSLSQAGTQVGHPDRHPGRHPGRHAGRHAGRVAGPDLHVHQRQRHQDVPPRRRA